MFKKLWLIAGVASALAAPLALSQTAAPNAPAVPFAAPPQMPYGLSINVDKAKTIAEASVAEAKKNNLNMAIAIVDTGGYLVYFEKMNNTQTGSVQLAIEKAQTSALFRRPSKVFQDGVAAGGEGLRLLRLTGTIPIEGGIPLVSNGTIVGAIGVSGGSGAQDNMVATAGATSAR